MYLPSSAGPIGAQAPVIIPVYTYLDLQIRSSLTEMETGTDWLFYTIKDDSTAHGFMQEVNAASVHHANINFVQC